MSTPAVPTNLKLVSELTKDEDELFYKTMFRITDGLPAYELHSIAKEAADCEAALQKEIALLEASLAAEETAAASSSPNDNDSSKNDSTKASIQSEAPESVSKQPPSHPMQVPIIPPEYDATNQTVKNYLPSTERIMQTELSPLDRYFTVSALLGRLREPFDTPPPPHSGLARARLASIAALERKKTKTKNNLTAQQTRRIQSVDKYDNILKLRDLNDIYTAKVKQGDNTALLALVKRISNHRTATVFRRAVDPKEAPGYIDRILFPIDLTLIKKMVVCGYITSFEELHQQIGLICHNCVKFNGRDSDYTMLTRDFESYVDDSFMDFLHKQKEKALAAKAASEAAGVAAAASAATGNVTGAAAGPGGK